MSRVSEYGCLRCASWTTSLLHARSVFAYEGTVQAAIHRLKYRNELAHAEWCGAEMAVSMSEDDLSSDVLIPVPLHPVRLRTRGYNQSERVGIVSQELLVRTRPTTSQVGLSAADRWINVRGAFQATGCLDGMAVLLIGDVMTTGATLQACAAACLAAGAEQVRSLTVATGS